MKRNVLLKMY